MTDPLFPIRKRALLTVRVRFSVSRERLSVTDPKLLQNLEHEQLKLIMFRSYDYTSQYLWARGAGRGKGGRGRKTGRRNSTDTLCCFSWAFPSACSLIGTLYH